MLLVGKILDIVVPRVQNILEKNGGGIKETIDEELKKEINKNEDKH